MAGIRAMLLVLGIVAIAFGLLWLGQGLGVIMWPESSEMLGNRRWALGGAGLAFAGIVSMRLSRDKR